MPSSLAARARAKHRIAFDLGIPCQCPVMYVSVFSLYPETRPAMPNAMYPCQLCASPCVSVCRYVYVVSFVSCRAIGQSCYASLRSSNPWHRPPHASSLLGRVPTCNFAPGVPLCLEPVQRLTPGRQHQVQACASPMQALERSRRRIRRYRLHFQSSGNAA